MLFQADRHQALGTATWDEARVRETIASIARDMAGARMACGHWPVHPLDVEGDTPSTGFKSLYLGSAGVWWALWELQRKAAVELHCNPAEEMLQVEADYRAEPDTGEVVPSYFLGEVGILLAHWRMTGSAQTAEKLDAAIRSNIPNPTNEALWAAPGTMVAALHLWEATGEQRWRELFLDNVDQLWRTWHFDTKANCHLWTQDMYGMVVQYLGAGHGFAGNVYPLLRGASLLDVERRDRLYARCLETLQAFAKFEGDAVNWPPGNFEPRPGRASMLMQWCHGAPGIVTALAHFPPQQSAAMESLLNAAGQAIWEAGPLAKGYGLCHGTAGNGYAFLSLYQRTGDSVWLDRARSFALHALEQRDHLRRQHGQGRYTLWTGAAGLAVYAMHCLDGRGGLPGLEVL